METNRTPPSSGLNALETAMIIGTNKETKNHEYRVALLPSGVEALRGAGHRVLVERGAGSGSGFDDNAYAAAGAELVDDSATLFAEAELIYKVKEPMTWEYELLREGQTLFTYIHSAGNRPLCDSLLKSRVCGIAFEDVLQEDGRLPLLEPMSFVAGYMGMLKGFELLQTVQGGPGILPGGMPGVKPARILILGAGLVGTGAAHVAAGLGADVDLLDVDLDKLEKAALRFPTARTLLSTAENIRACLPQADILLNAVSWPKTRKGHLVTGKMLHDMPSHGIVVDVAADIRGGLETCERQTTHDEPTYVAEGHIHYVVANIPSLAGRSASEALAAVTLPHALRIANRGTAQALLDDAALRRGVTCHGGDMVRAITADWYGCPSITDEELVARLRG